MAAKHTREQMDAKQSYVHVYTGNGKGKTTAAIGLAVRASLAGKRVFIAQFVKGMEYSELGLPNFLPNVELKQYGRTCFIYNDPTPDDVEAARVGLAACRELLAGGAYDLVVLDELNIALYYRLFSVEEAIEAIQQRASHTEVVATGRYAPQQLLKLADLVTEMCEVKHYYTKGVEARKGVEF